MEKTDTFFAGMLSGVLVLAAVLISASMTPKAEQRRFRNEAVSAGAAEWIISTDSNGSPALEFRWKQSK